MSPDLHPTKIKILQEATQVFAEKGFNGATTKEIAQRLDISEGTLFRHFSSKQEILYGVVENIVPIIGVGSLESTFVESEDLSAEEALRLFIADRLTLLKEKNMFFRIIFTEMQYDPQLRDLYQEKVLQPIQQIVSRFFTQRIQRGEFRELDPQAMVNVLSYIIFNIGFQSLFVREDKDELINADMLTDILLYGFQRQQAKQYIEFLGYFLKFS